MRLFFSIVFSLLVAVAVAQPITGTWRGKVSKGRAPFSTTYKVEVKIIRHGDSLKGTSYYYANATNYYRYAIRGYLDATDGSLHWWDEELLESKGGKLGGAINKQPLAMQADFNCPGSGIMKLDGKGETKNGDGLEVHLDKEDEPLFADGWNELIESWWQGGADPDWIAQTDQEQRQANKTDPQPGDMARVETPIKPGTSNKEANPNPVPPPPPTVVVKSEPQPEKTPAIVPKAPPAPTPLLTAREKFETRERVVQTTIPMAGDSIELQFFDNAEIDGDSIALFLNGRLLFEHVKLSAQPFVIHLAVADLPDNAELSMVAENLGAIPPNTSFMMAYVNGQRHTARLESTEQTTAVIRFKKEG